MSYAISGMPGPSVPISEQHFLELQSAKAHLQCARSVEECYDMLIDAYLDLHAEVNLAALECAIRPMDEMNRIEDRRRAHNRAILNFLSVASQQIDHTKHNVSELSAASGLMQETVDAWFSHEYDIRFGYRVMQALRNSAQHSMFATHGVTWGGEVVEDAGESKRRHSFQPQLVPAVLERNPDFKRSVLKELKKKGDRNMAGGNVFNFHIQSE